MERRGPRGDRRFFCQRILALSSAYGWGGEALAVWIFVPLRFGHDLWRLFADVLVFVAKNSDRLGIAQRARLGPRILVGNCSLVIVRWLLVSVNYSEQRCDDENKCVL